MDPQTEDFFKKHRKTHNDGVFDVYTPEMRAARTAHIVTGLLMRIAVVVLSVTIVVSLFTVLIISLKIKRTI